MFLFISRLVVSEAPVTSVCYVRFYQKSKLTGPCCWSQTIVVRTLFVSWAVEISHAICIMLQRHKGVQIVASFWNSALSEVGDEPIDRHWNFVRPHSYL